MNSVYITGEIAKQPLEMIDSENKKAYYKLAIKTKRNAAKVDDHYDFVNLKVYKNQVDNITKLDVGSKVFAIASFKSYGEYDNQDFNTELHASLINELN
ncbi:single-stranded DNA-binding protein [Spiroplasma endosymbiont of Aspidapion aeneum]|uniref:single-stranded DNA-binding protein n=1 Tax=Spiroplasma endosymbiont of Aspidapion aeneum TaxID=3066276 RepID=UPI00313EC37B